MYKKENPKAPTSPHHSQKYIGGEVTRGGAFKGDSEMPMFSVHEGEAAVAYLDVLMEVVNARKNNFTTVTVNYTEMPLATAQIERDRLLKKFKDTVAEETRRKNPEATLREIRQRQHDILAAHNDTGYIPAHPSRG
ncbi:MAG: hypothetical protein K2Q01_03180 [Rickettsiales bacterium]|nr:hypothetical protein [Rickettsiales bacterium]